MLNWVKWTAAVAISVGGVCAVAYFAFRKTQSSPIGLDNEDIPYVTYDFDLREVDGTIVVSAHQILEYEWTTHIVRLVPGVTERLNKTRIHCGPFEVCVGGQPIYRGKFIHGFSSIYCEGVVLDFYSFRSWSKNCLQLELRPPLTKSGELGSSKILIDPRGDPKIREALEKTGKLR